MYARVKPLMQICISLLYIYIYVYLRYHEVEVCGGTQRFCITGALSSRCSLHVDLREKAKSRPTEGHAFSSIENIFANV